MLDDGEHVLLIVGVLDLLRLDDALFAEDFYGVETEVVSTADCVEIEVEYKRGEEESVGTDRDERDRSCLFRGCVGR